MYKYYIPFYYLILSRLKSKIDIASWIIIFIIPPFIMGLYTTNMELITYILVFTIANISFYSLYEIGYLENDIQTTKKEKNPTIRIEKKVQKYLDSKYLKIVFFKYFTVIISIVILYFLINDIQNTTSFILLLIISRIFFYLHNTFRSRINIFTFFILAITKYTMILFLLIPIDKLFSPLILSIVIFPLLRTMEHASRKKYNFISYAKLIGNHDLFRLKYYLFFIFLILIFTYLSIEPQLLIISMVLLIYFFIFRLASYLLITKNIYERDKLKTKDIIKD